MRLQKTIKNDARVSGKGLFTGQETEAIFRPAPENTGIVFVRTDTDEPVYIEALVSNLSEHNRRTTLKKGDVSVETVEHCLAAVSALELNNLIIELNGAELPSPDCSSLEFFKVLKDAGSIEQKEMAKEFVITEPIAVTSGDASIYALPGSNDSLNITYDLHYAGYAGLDRQIYTCNVTTETFEKNLAPARTFLLKAEAVQFQARGLGKHLGPNDILVIDSDGPVKNKFVFPDECARHKIVDMIGDITLMGQVVKGRIIAYKSGHILNQQLAKKLYEQAQKQQRLAKSGTDAILNIRQISKILPHRYPFLLVDKVIEVEGETRIKALKNVSYNEQFFQGHFPGTPIMPGVLIVEAMAQVSGLLFAQTLEHTGKLAVLLGMNDVKLRRAVVPGDQLIIESQVIKSRKRTALCRCKASVEGVLAAEAQIKFMLVDDEKI